MQCNPCTPITTPTPSENSALKPCCKLETSCKRQTNRLQESSEKEVLIGSIDEGTSSVRFTVFSAGTAKIVASYQKEVASIYPHAKWVEQDAKLIINTVLECIEKTMNELNARDIQPSDIKTVGITNQRETTVLWDKITGEPLYNAIIWMDNRTQPTIESLLATKPTQDINQLRDLTGLPINPYFSATKYRWLIDNVPAVQKAIQEKRCMFGTIDSWVIWNITGGTDNGIHITDVTNASRTLLMNIDTLQWDSTLTDFFGISMDTLPEIRSSSEVYGNMTVTSLKGVPISGCVGDQQAALIGQLCFNEGDSKCTYGTGCFTLTNTGVKKVKSTHGLLTTVAYKIGKKASPVYALEGSVASGGTTMIWLRDSLKMVSDVTEIEKLAREVSTTGDVFFVPGFQGLYAPYWEPKARGMISGLTMESDRRHIARAAIEGVGYQIAAILNCIRKDSQLESKVLKVDGGMGRNNLLLQFQADISGITIAKQEMLESTSFGAAIAAGLAEEINLIDLSKLKMNVEMFQPTFSNEEREERMAKWEKTVKRSIIEN